MPPCAPDDKVDAVCMRHDLAWCKCYASIEERGIQKAHPLRLATRFFTMPPAVYRRRFDREFRECILKVPFIYLQHKKSKQPSFSPN